MRKALIIGLLFATFPLFCIPLESVDILGGMLWIGNAQRSDETTGAPNPLIQEFGVAFPIRLSSILLLEPSILYYGLEYGFDEGPRPRPVQIEHREMYVMNWVADIGLLFPIKIIEKLTISPGINITGVFKIPIIPAPGEEDRSADMNSYFYSDARYLLPGACVKLDWQFSNQFSFILKTGTRLPIFHLWDGEALPFYDQMEVFCDVGFSYKLGSSIKSESAEPVE